MDWMKLDMRSLVAKVEMAEYFGEISYKTVRKFTEQLWKNKIIFSELHNSMTKLCSALFKCENKLKIGWENQCTAFLQCTKMRAHVEKSGRLGLNQVKY